MKRITFLMAVFSVFCITSFAQIMPTIDVSLKHSQIGIVNEIAPYSTGIVYISNDGTNDVVSYTLDGTAFVDVESLATGTAMDLVGWADSDVAIYLGDNTEDAVGVELRKLEAGSAVYIDDYAPMDQTLGAGSGVLRYTDGANYSYHFILNNGTDMFGGATTAPAYTDGTFYAELINSQFGAQVTDSKMQGTMFNNDLYYAGSVGSGWASNPGIFQFDGTALNAVYTGDQNQLYGFLASTDYMYFLNGFYGSDTDNGSLWAMDTNHDVTSVLNGDGIPVMVENVIDMQLLNNKAYAIENQNQVTKLVEISGANAKSFHLNAEGVSDNIVDMVVSGNYVYVLASITDGNTELYAINPSRNDAQFVLASSLNGNYGTEQSLLTAIDGGVAFISNTGSGDYIFISDGNDGNAKSLIVQGAPTLAVTNLQSTGDNLYIFSENAGNTDIYQYVVAAFPTIGKNVTVQEAVTGVFIEGATVKFDTGLEMYSGTTDANGTVTITAPLGYLNAIISATGYATVTEEYYVGGFFADPTYELTAAKDFAFVVYDESLYDPLMGGGELEGATVVLTAGETTYSATTLGDLDAGFANFTDVVYGTYDYAVSMNGFITSTGTFTVNSSTNGGLFVGLTPVTTGIDNTKKVNISLYPNPVLDVLYIQSEVEVNSVEVYNLSGSLVKTVQGSSISSVQVSDLASGIYLVKVKNTEGFVSNVKVQKR